MTMPFLSVIPIKGRIILYSVAGCSHCVQAKALLHEKGLPYIDVDLDLHPEERKLLSARIGTTSFTVPQIYFNSIHVGGNTELRSLVTELDHAKWNALLREVRTMEPDNDAPVPPTHSPPAHLASAGLDTDAVDAYADLAQDLYKSDIVTCVRTGLFSSVKGAFTGRQFVDWFLLHATNNAAVSERHDAVSAGQELLHRLFLMPSSSADLHAKPLLFRDANDAVYQLPLAATGDNTFENGVLNSRHLTVGTQRDASVIATDLRKMISGLYQDFVSEDGKSVDYDGMSKSAQFINYERLSEQLQRTTVDSLTRNERLAFFINIYNALVIHWRIAKGPARGSYDRMQAFRTAAYIIGGRRYTLNDIEHGILRGNTRPPYYPVRQISPCDPRAAYAFDKPDPRIHFALNCGAKSCPPIRAYKAEKIDEQLQLATEAFLGGEDGVVVEESENVVHLSKLLSWYARDFGGSPKNVLEWVFEHMPGDDDGQRKKKAGLRKVIDSRNFKVKYLEYDWDHNSISS